MVNANVQSCLSRKSGRIYSFRSDMDYTNGQYLNNRKLLSGKNSYETQ